MVTCNKYAFLLFILSPPQIQMFSYGLDFLRHNPSKKPIALHPIVFPKVEDTKGCQLRLGGAGVCLPLEECESVKKRLNEGSESLDESICWWGPSYKLFVCCSTQEHFAEKSIIYDTSKPTYNFAACGEAYFDDGCPYYAFQYSGNVSADYFKSLGFDIIPVKMDVDKLERFNITNGTYSETIDAPRSGCAAGGEDARRVVTVYMAILGERRENNATDWFCDGVIINRDWVLSAAHCFLQRNANVVRLGEYDLSSESESRPLDFGIAYFKIYPEYQYPSSYHDLSLIKLDRSIPYHRYDMRPICLPWDEEARRNLTGQKVILTGWGAVIHAGPMTPIIQEVNVTILDPAVCDQSYSTLSDYSSKFPKGIRSETSVCAGDLEGGKDACQGDSGGPIVYQNSFGNYTLAGIVSAGYGCGLKEFPGIYVPIQNPEYLSWIKQVAFG